MDAAMHDGGGRVARGRGPLHNAPPDAVAPIPGRSTPGYMLPMVGTEGSTGFLHAVAVRQRQSVQPQCSALALLHNGANSEQAMVLVTVIGSVTTNVSLGRKRQSVVENESPNYGAAASHPTTASVRFQPTAVKGIGYAMAFLRRSDRKAGSRVAEAFDTRLSRSEHCRNDDAGGVTRVGAVPESQLRRQNRRGGDCPVASRSPPTLHGPGGFRYVVALAAKLIASVYL